MVQAQTVSSTQKTNHMNITMFIIQTWDTGHGNRDLEMFADGLTNFRLIRTESRKKFHVNDVKTYQRV